MTRWCQTKKTGDGIAPSRVSHVTNVLLCVQAMSGMSADRCECCPLSQGTTPGDWRRSCRQQACKPRRPWASYTILHRTACPTFKQNKYCNNMWKLMPRRPCLERLMWPRLCPRNRCGTLDKGKHSKTIPILDSQTASSPGAIRRYGLSPEMLWIFSWAELSDWIRKPYHMR